MIKYHNSVKSLLFIEHYFSGIDIALLKLYREYIQQINNSLLSHI